MTKSTQQTTSLPTTVTSSQIWDAPQFNASAMRHLPQAQKLGYRLFHISEIAEGKANAYRLAMANVISSLDNTNCRTIYVLSGTPEGVNLYVGVASSVLEDDEIRNMAKVLKSSFEGNFLGAKLAKIEGNNHKVNDMLQHTKHLGLVTGVPSFNEEDVQVRDEDFQSIERLANSLVGEIWKLIIVAEPGQEHEVRDTLQRIYDFSTELSSHQKQSVQRSENTGWSNSEAKGISDSKSIGTSLTDSRGKSEGVSEGTGKNSGTSSGSSSTRSEGTSSNEGKNWGTNESMSKGTTDSKTQGTNQTVTKGESGGKSLAYTSERTDKQVEEMQKHISENLIPRFQQGRSKGMFRTAVYLGADEPAVYDRLSRGVLSLFQGNQSTMTPLRVDKLEPQNRDKTILLSVQHYAYRQSDQNQYRALTHSIPFELNTQTLCGGTWLTTRELSLLAGLPSKELPGLKIRKSVDFALNTTGDALPENETLNMGHIIQHGRKLERKPIRLSIADLDKHVFVTGVTGSGKTTTCKHLLLESGLPFMVIEPAKTEYRTLHSKCQNLQCYVLGREDISPFRLNPFELVSKDENLAGHIDNLKATLAAVFPMEASMPYIVAQAITNAYKTKGWDIHSGTNFNYEDDDTPWVEGSNAWPTFSDMITELDGVIKAAGMGREFEEKYKGSLVSRLTDLTLGTKGRMLNTRHSIDFDKLLDEKVVIELEELKDEQDKALFMGFILQRLAECMKLRHRRNSKFKHLTLVEEAHRLLSRPEPGESSSKKQGVETFANMLAEVRKYGEVLIIADQIPNKLVSDVIKNTHTKIVHRLFAADDRNTIGDAMGLSDEQKDFLPLLQTGETVMYCGGWHAAVRVKVEKLDYTSADEVSEDDLKSKGQQLMWAQRHRLYPRLASRLDNAQFDAQNLGRFVHIGTQLLNILLRINYSNPAIDKANDEALLKPQKRFAKMFDELLTQYHLRENVSATLLTELFFDVSGFNQSEATNEMMWQVLPKGILALSKNLEAFLALRIEREARQIFKYISNKNIWAMEFI